MSKVAYSLLGLSLFLVLSGVALLFGSSSTPYALRTVEQEASTAYSSELVIAYDIDTSASSGLAIGGGILLVGGLMVSAAAVGLRYGQKAAIDE